MPGTQGNLSDAATRTSSCAQGGARNAQCLCVPPEGRWALWRPSSSSLECRCGRRWPSTGTRRRRRRPPDPPRRRAACGMTVPPPGGFREVGPGKCVTNSPDAGCGNRVTDCDQLHGCREACAADAACVQINADDFDDRCCWYVDSNVDLSIGPAFVTRTCFADLEHGNGVNTVHHVATTASRCTPNPYRPYPRRRRR